MLYLHQNPLLHGLLLSYDMSKPEAEERPCRWLHAALEKAVDTMKQNRNYRE